MRIIVLLSSRIRTFVSVNIPVNVTLFDGFFFLNGGNADRAMLLDDSSINDVYTPAGLVFTLIIQTVYMKKAKLDSSA